THRRLQGDFAWHGRQSGETELSFLVMPMLARVRVGSFSGIRELPVTTLPLAPTFFPCPFRNSPKQSHSVHLDPVSVGNGFFAEPLALGNGNIQQRSVLPEKL